VEVFSGGCSPLFIKRISPIEIINDTESSIVNFFRVLRDPDMSAEFKDLCKAGSKYQKSSKKDQVKLAYEWFMMQRGSFISGGASSVFLQHNAKRGVAGNVINWLSEIDGLPMVHARLVRCQIEHSDFKYMFDTYDGKDVFFYCNPFYYHDSSSGVPDIKNKISDDAYKSLLKILRSIQGKVMLIHHGPVMDVGLDGDVWRMKQWGPTAEIAYIKDM